MVSLHVVVVAELDVVDEVDHRVFEGLDGEVDLVEDVVVQVVPQQFRPLLDGLAAGMELEYLPIEVYLYLARRID